MADRRRARRSRPGVERPRSVGLREGQEAGAILSEEIQRAARDDEDRGRDRSPACRASRRSAGCRRRRSSAPLKRPSAAPTAIASSNDGEDRQVRRGMVDRSADDHAGQREIGGDRQVDAARQDHHHLRQRHHEQDGGVGEDADRGSRASQRRPAREAPMRERRAPATIGRAARASLMAQQRREAYVAASDALRLRTTAEWPVAIASSLPSRGTIAPRPCAVELARRCGPRA